MTSWASAAGGSAYSVSERRCTAAAPILVRRLGRGCRSRAIDKSRSQRRQRQASVKIPSVHVNCLPRGVHEELNLPNRISNALGSTR